jgi:hypothetical protein
MARPKEDLPPLLQPGEHAVELGALECMCVDEFPLSQTRAEIMRGFDRIYNDLIRLKIPCDIVFDGSFLTKEIDPDDVDFAVVVAPELYESCSREQLKYLDWIRDEHSIRTTHLCHCYLSVEYPKSHPEYFDGIQNREFWVSLYSKSIIYQRVGGVAIIHVA